ncbi:MAG TPA: hypothetical protein DCM50_13300 [Stenotrophomonas sp.]|nr:hypothetical protein [Stenotrophomonas sp.]
MKRWHWMVAVVVVITAAGLAWTFRYPAAQTPLAQGPLPTPLGWQARIETVAGDGVDGLREGAGAQARFADPYALAIDAQGVAYIADAGDNNRIRRLYPDGRVDTLAGNGEGWRDGPALQAQFHTPSGIALDAAGNVYVADTGNHRIRRIGTDGAVTTLAGDGQAGFADGPLPSASPDMSDRLSQWLDWNRAVALSRALDGRLPPVAADAPVFDSAEQAECARVHAVLATSIRADADARRAAAGEDYAPHRQHCVNLQRSMQAATGRLRGRLRDMLGHGSAELARLAEVDAVMEQTLSPREHALLGAVPALLGQHFERLRAAASPAPGDGDNDEALPDTAHPGWLARFHQDMQDVLLAELDVRFQPIEGLLAALRPR